MVKENSLMRAEKQEYNRLKREVNHEIQQLAELIWGQEQWTIWNRPGHACQQLDFFVGASPHNAEMLYLHAKPWWFAMRYWLSADNSWTRSSVEQIASTTAKLKRLLSFLKSQVRKWDFHDWS